jgi:hypothetical protein
VNEIQSAILTLKVILTIAPMAGYFLILGVVNSQACPRLVSGRRDFLVLTGTFLPIIFWPLAAVADSFGWLMVAAILVLSGMLLRTMLPHPWKHWVVYNADASLASTALRQALDRLGWEYEQEGEATYSLPRRQMKIEVAGVGLLNAVNLYIRTEAKDPAQAEVATLVEAVSGSLGRYELLPSPAGLFLVLIGAGLMIVPMYMMTHHMRDIVQTIERLFVG